MGVDAFLQNIRPLLIKPLLWFDYFIYYLFLITLDDAITMMIAIRLYYHTVLFAAETNATAESKKTHMDNLWRMVSYCENSLDCRRVQQLEYFGEYFDKSLCKEYPGAACDNCSSAVS